MTRKILGSKGGGGASFVTKPDTLRSNDSFEILLGLGSGRWKGLTNGLGSLKINGVPMENEDGTSNFEDVHALFADGNPLEDQLVTFKLGGGGQTQSINTPLSNLNSSGPGPWVSGAVSTLNANFIDMRFVVQQLFYQDEKSIRENTATIEIEMRPTGSADWINPFLGAQSQAVEYNNDGYNIFEGTFLAKAYLARTMFNSNGIGFKATNNPNLVIRGKTNSAYVKELRIAVPNEGIYADKSWEVRARLIEKDTNDADKIQERRNLVFESITAVINEPLGDHPDWDGQVWMQIYGKASNQFSGFPEIEGTFDTKICKVPPTNIFDPDTRIYSGLTWDGSYEEHFTTDPAWQIKEFVEDPVQGLAGLQPGSTLDKWDALEASKYYSEQVPDGKGGTHPRFSLNLTINEAREVEEMMGYLAGAVNSYTEDVGGGVWRLKVDKPETPVMLFTEDNIFGEFNYSHTDVDTRFNDWRGTFLNEDLDYQTDTVRVHNQDDIDANGMRFTEVALVGCTNEQEALRRLMFRLRVSLNEYKIVTFVTNRIGRYISPLSTILVADAALNAEELVKSTSRFNFTSGNIATLLRPVRLEVGVNYVMHFTTTDQKTVTRTVVNASGARGDQTEIYLDSALPANIMPESAVALEAVGLGSNPVSYRVIAVERSEEDEDQYAITASIIDSGKWDAMDNVSQTDLNAQSSIIEIDSPTVPAGGMFDTLVYPTEFDLKRVLQVNWDRPGGSYLDGYQVEYRINDGSWKRLSDRLSDSFIEFENPEDGIYDFRITALDRRGVKSNPLIGRYELVGSRDFIAPTHLRGTLAQRPLVGLYDGFRFTVIGGIVPITYVWDDGAWVAETNLVTSGSQIGVEDGATVGAQTGVNLVDSGSVVLDDAAVKNTAVTIGSDGQLSGAGGGQVTITGLGYVGDLNATQDLKLTPGNGGSVITIKGNSVRKDNVGDVYDHTVVGPAARGPGYVESDIIAGNYTMVAMDDISTSSTTPGTQRVLGYYNTNGLANLFINGASVFSATVTANLAGKLRLIYDGAKVYLYAGNLLLTSAAAPAALGTNAWYPKWTIYNNNVWYTGLGTGVAMERNWVNFENRPTNLTVLTGNEGINNAGISLSAGGALSGAGGGQITPIGLEASSGLGIRNVRMAIGADVLGVGGRARVRLIDDGFVLTDYELPSVAQNLDISVSSNNITGIGTGNNTPVANAGVSLGAGGNLAGGGGGQITLTGLETSNGGALIRNGLLSISGDVSGTGGRARVNLLNNGGVLTNLQMPSVMQNLDISVSSNNITGIGTGNNTPVANGGISINAQGALAGGGGGQVTIAGIAPNLDPYATRGENLIINGDFRQGLTGYYFGGTAAYIGLGGGHPATYGVSFPAVNDYVYPNGASAIAVKAGTVYVGGDFIANTAGNAMVIGYAAYDALGNSLANSTASLGSIGTTYSKKQVAITLPPNTASFQVLFQKSSHASATYGTNFFVSSMEQGATVGAAWSSNLTGRPTNVAALAGSEGINNASVSISAGGALSGGGGGQVTIGGLGYSGALNASGGENITNTDLSTLAAGNLSFNLTNGGNQSKWFAGSGTDPVPGFVRVTSGTIIQPADYFPLRGGAPINLRAYFRSSVASAGCRARVNVFYYNAAGSFISASELGASGSTTGWEARSLADTIPATAVRGLIRVSDDGMTTGSCDVGDIRVSYIEEAADVTKAISGATVLTVEYTSAGVSTNLPITAAYKLTPMGGVSYTSGVTWSITTVAGSWSGTAPSISGTGLGALTINSGPSGDECIINVVATVNGKASPPFAVKVNKLTALPTSSSGSGGGSAFADDNTLDSLSSNSYVALSNELNITTASGSTSAALTASNISFRPSKIGGIGEWAITVKWEWWNGSSWVIVGSAVTSSSNSEVVTDLDGFTYANSTTVTCNQTKTGLTANTAYKFRYSAYISLGSARAHSVAGTVSAQG